MKIQFNDIFAVTAPGLEQVCAVEIRRLLDCEAVPEKGGVSFSGGLEELYLANLWLRTASRVLVRVGSVRATDFPELFRKVKKLPWGRFVKPDTAIEVRATSHRSRLLHTERISNTISDAIDKALGRSALPQGAAEPKQLIIARLEGDQCLLSVDSSGELLHRRGYRSDISQAPLRETLAAGVLQLLGWDGHCSLYDPMCGSGTFLVEAALLAGRKPPGLQRVFAFQSWPRYRKGMWENLLVQAKKVETEVPVQLAGSDRDAGVVLAAGRNAERAGCGDTVRFEHIDINQVAPPSAHGLIVCNPPYGVRIGDKESLRSLYREMGAVFRSRFSGWQIALFCPASELVAETGINFQSKAELTNGGIPTRLFVAQL